MLVYKLCLNKCPGKMSVFESLLIFWCTSPIAGSVMGLLQLRFDFDSTMTTNEHVHSFAESYKSEGNGRRRQA